jgi:hypothetical protein
VCPGLAEQRTGRGNLRRGGACTTRRPVRCEECGRCDMHCETMLEKGRHCHSDSEEEDGDEQEDEEEHADAGDGGAEADDEEEEDTEEMLIKDLVEFFSLSKSFAHYTYKLTAASTPSATAHSNAYRLLTRITAQVGEILKARGAADDVVEQWHAAEAGPALGDVQERAAELLDSLPVRCPGHQAVAMLMCAASPSRSAGCRQCTMAVVAAETTSTTCSPPNTTRARPARLEPGRQHGPTAAAPAATAAAPEK